MYKLIILHPCLASGSDAASDKNADREREKLDSRIGLLYFFNAYSRETTRK